MSNRKSKLAHRVTASDRRTWVLGNDGDTPQPMSRRQRRLLAHVEKRGTAGRIVPTLTGGVGQGR